MVTGSGSGGIEAFLHEPSESVYKASGRAFNTGGCVLFDSDFGEQFMLDLLIENLPLMLAVSFSLLFRREI